MLVRIAIEDEETLSGLPRLLLGGTVQTLGRDLAGWLQSKSPDLEEGVALVRTLCTTLWMTVWTPTDEDPLPDPTERFCILYSFRNGAHVKARYITKLFAMFKYMLRLHIISVIAASTDPVEKCEETERWFTDKVTLSTFSMLCNWQHIASTIVMCETVVPSIHWIDRVHWSEFMYRGDRIRLDDVRKMFSHMQDELVHHWENDILLGLDIALDTRGLTEDLSTQHPGYSFLSDPRNAAQLKGMSTALLDGILASETLLNEFSVVVDGKRKWNRTRLNLWLARYNAQSLRQLCCSETLSGGPFRGTELTSMLYRSSPEQPVRNVAVMDKYVVLLSTYSKTSSISGSDRIIPHALDSVTADIILRDLIIARPFAILAASVCYPNEPEVVDRYRSYLFVNGKKNFTTDDISEALKALTLVFLLRGYGIQAWRHFIIAWRRKLCPSATDFLENEHEDYIGAEQAGHSARVERQVYGLSPDALSGPTEDILPLFLKASCNWQKAMQIVPGAPSQIRSMICYLFARSHSMSDTKCSSFSLFLHLALCTHIYFIQEDSVCSTRADATQVFQLW